MENKDNKKVKVQVKGLVKSFGELEVLKGMDLEVADGEVVCLIGPSGSGKSTFLKGVLTDLKRSPEEKLLSTDSTSQTRVQILIK